MEKNVSRSVVAAAFFTPFVAVQYSTVEIFSDLCICFTVGEQWAA